MSIALEPHPLVGRRVRGKGKFAHRGAGVVAGVSYYEKTEAQGRAIHNVLVVWPERDPGWFWHAHPSELELVEEGASAST